MDKLLLIGVNHKVAPAVLRERLAFSSEGLIQAVQSLKHALTPDGTSAPADDAVEAALLSTCNRTEVILRTADPCHSEEVVRSFLNQTANLGDEALAEVLYVYRGCEAVSHLLEVAAGLDSLVVGENEIQGQVREAFELAHKAGTSGPYLNSLFRMAVQCGKRVRTETEIGKTKLSVATLVVELAEDYLGGLQQHTALIIGAGKISTLTARELVRAGLRCVLIANRTLEHAQKLAHNLGVQHASAVHFDQLNENLTSADIVICSTGAPHIVLHADVVAAAMKSRPGQPMLVVDLAIPRDADPEISNLPNVALFAIDDLAGLVQERHPLTAEALQESQAIIEEELSAYQSWSEARRVAPLIRSLRAKAETIVEAEVKRTLKRLGPLSDDKQAAIELMGQSIVNKLLHEPIICLKDVQGESDAPEVSEIVRELFGLHEPILDE